MDDIALEVVRYADPDTLWIENRRLRDENNRLQAEITTLREQLEDKRAVHVSVKPMFGIRFRKAS